MAKNQLDQYLRPLTDNEVVFVEKLDYSLFIRFGPGITVATESLWRLIGEGRIVVTSEDHGHQFGLPEPVDAGAALSLSVRGRSVTVAEIDPSSGDLTIDLGKGCGCNSFRRLSATSRGASPPTGSRQSVAEAVRSFMFKLGESTNTPLQPTSGTDVVSSC